LIEKGKAFLIKEADLLLFLKNETIEEKWERNIYDDIQKLEKLQDKVKDLLEHAGNLSDKQLRALAAILARIDKKFQKLESF
jgi:hypothetical protein